MKRDDPRAAHFEATVRLSGPAMERLGRLLCVSSGTVALLDASARDPGLPFGEADLLLLVVVGYVSSVMETLRPVEWRYRSPTHFLRGALHALYASAADEVADRRPGVRWPEHRRLCQVCARTPEDWASGEDSDYQSHCERGWGLRLAHELVP